MGGGQDLAFLIELRPDVEDGGDTWLVATADGDHWITLDVPDNVWDFAINCDRVLLQLFDDDLETTSWEIARIPAG
jgi:hypothetical protein